MPVSLYHIYATRRKRLAKTIGDGSVIIIPSASAKARNGDSEYPFRQDSNMLYLSGFPETDAFLIITGGDDSRSLLFSAPNDPEKEMWNGKRFGQEGAKVEFGFDETHNIEGTDSISVISELLWGKQRIYYPFDHERAEVLQPIFRVNDTGSGTEYKDSAPLIAEMRVIKDHHEIIAMSRAANISAMAHREILDIVHVGMSELELENELSYRFRKAGGDALHAYQPIVASGENACTLHHRSTSRYLRDGELVLIDAGCEYQGYAADITRTFPVNGRFTPEQRAIYEIVLEAQKAAIRLAVPDVRLSLLQDAATLVITEGLMRLGILPNGDPHMAIANGAHRPFYPHGVSHFLGLDVHDAGDYASENMGGRKRSGRRLETGMVITVEPGIYIRKEAAVGKRWGDIGVRIEDDVLITHDGNRVLSANAPKEIAAIEAIMNKR